MKLFSRPFIPAFAWFIITVILLTLPGNRFPQDEIFQIPHQDKIIHFIFFFLIVYLFSRPFKNADLKLSQKITWFLIIALSAIAYGVIIEFVQQNFIAYRSFDVWDIIADAAGCLTAFIYSRKYFGSGKSRAKK